MPRKNPNIERPTSSRKPGRERLATGHGRRKKSDSERASGISDAALRGARNADSSHPAADSRVDPEPDDATS